MEVRLEKSDRGLVFFSSAILVMFCALIIFLTWSNVHRQRDLLENHLRLTAQVVLRGVQGTLMREVRRGFRGGRMGMMGGMPPAELFSDLVDSRELRFAGILGPGGRVLYSSSKGESPVPDLPPELVEALHQDGQWSGFVDWQGEEILLMGIRAMPILARACLEGDEQCTPGEAHNAFLIIGLNVGPYMVEFQEFKRAAVYQTGVVIVSAALFLVFITAYLRRREAGQKLEALEHFHSELLDAMPDGLLSLDGSGKIRAANRSACDILEARASELIGRSWSDISRERTGETDEGGGWKQFDLAGRKLEVLSKPVEEGGESGRLVLIRDRTAIKTLEERLGAAEKLAAVGRMAAGVAHEIRNPLSSLRGFAQLFMGKFKGQQPEEEYAATMVREADRLNKVITGMLYLARPSRLEPAPQDVAAAFGELETLMRLDLAEKNAVLRLDIQAPLVPADADALKQVLLNLAMNAHDALPEQGGAITLTAVEAPGGVCISVADNGSGMSEEDIAHALEPFYTTKKEGTGLGLAIVNTIMNEHGGHIEIASREGEGTEVRLFFPDGGE